MRVRRPRPAVVLPRALAAAAVAVLGGCASISSGAAPGPVPAEATPSTAAPADDVLVLENCGFEVTLDGVPERLVTIKSSATEAVLALGAGDRLVATAFPDGPLPDDLTGLTDAPLLSDKAPSAEAILEVEPDLVVAGWESNLTAESGGDRRTLAELGVATYVSPSACKDPAHRPDRLTFDHVLEEITELGVLLGEPEAAQALVAEQRAMLEDLERDDRGLTALWYSSGTDVPYVGAGIGAPQMLMDAVGLVNVAGDVEDTWASFSWEAVADADPDVIVLVDSLWNSADKKRDLLASSPATRDLSAVRAERYLVVPFPATEAGVRNVPAALDLAAQLAAIG